jgi:hypothetical protein
MVYNTKNLFIFLKWYTGRGGVQFGPLGTAATNRPTVPAPGDYEIGGKIGKGNRSTRGKPALVHHRRHMLPGHEPGPPQWKASSVYRRPLEAVTKQRLVKTVTG